MKRTEPLSIAQILDKLLKSRGMEQTMLCHRALQYWPQVVGPVINRQTVERRLNGSVIMVRIASAPMRAELAMNRSRLIEAINSRVGKPVITDIKFF